MKPSLTPFLLIPAALLLALLPAAPSAAGPGGLAFTLHPTTITANKSAADQVFTFSGTLTNDTSTPLYLNGDLFTVDSALTGDDSDFINTFVFPTDMGGNPTAQPTLGVGQSITDPLFTVTLPAGTVPGTYGGLFEIQGGPTVNDYGLLASQSFTVHATSAAPVPEASSGASLAAGLLLIGGLAVASRRRKAGAGA